MAADSNIEDFIPEDKKSVLPFIKKWRDDMTARKLKSSEYKGTFLPVGFEAKNVEYLNNEWKGANDDDIYIFTYPKTGTNWTAEVVSKIVNVRQPPQGLQLYKKVYVPFMFLEMGPIEKFELWDSFPLHRRVIVSHLPANITPMDKILKNKAKVLYVLRNPKDQTVSWFHFMTKMPTHSAEEQNRYPKDWKSFTDSYLKGKINDFGKVGEWYPEHILSFYKYKENENVKFVYYEDMKEDLTREVGSIAKFLGVDLSETEVAEIAESCGFQAMKNDYASKKDENSKMLQQVNMFRKGEVGGWKEYFTVAQSEFVDEEVDKKLRGTDIKFKYQL